MPLATNDKYTQRGTSESTNFVANYVSILRRGMLTAAHLLAPQFVSMPDWDGPNREQDNVRDFTIRYYPNVTRACLARSLKSAPTTTI